MSDTRRRITVYYNVDGGYWCDAQGNFCVPSMIPIFRKNEKVAIQLSLIHNYGDNAEELVSFSELLTYTCVVYDDNRNVLFRSLVDAVNSEEGKSIWEEADASCGKFVILLTCVSSALSALLETYPLFRANIEFAISEGSSVLAIYRERVYCEQTLIDSQVINEGGVMANSLVVIDYPIPIGLSEVSRIFNNEQYRIVSLFLESPATALENASILNYQPTVTGFIVHLSTPITDAGYVLHYTYVEKE